MGRLNLKCIFPSNYFSENPVKIKLDNKLLCRVRPGDEISKDVDFEVNCIAANVLQHRHSIQITKTLSGEKYFILKWRGKTSVARVLYGLSTQGFELMEVSKKTYEQFDQNYYNSSPRAEGNLDVFSMLGIILLSLFFGYLSIYSTELSESTKEYALFVFLIGLVATASVFFDRKRISLLDARLRIFSNAFLQLILIISLSWQSHAGTWLLLLPVIVVFSRSGLLLFSAFYSGKSEMQIQN